MEKKKSVKDTLAEIKMMRKASEKRQAGKNTTSEDIKARMEKREMDKAKQDLKAQKKDARKAGRKFSMPKDKPQEQTSNKTPRRRPTGREEMIAQRYMDNEKRKKDGGSPVVGG